MYVQQWLRLMLGISLMIPMWVSAAVKTFHLTIAEQTVNITGKPVKRITVNGQFPAPLLEFEEGDDAVIHVQNNLKNQESSIHWHGLLLPGLMDGVPGFNGFNAIQSGDQFTYRFKVRQSGTYWYHAHSKGQEQDGLYGPLVIYPQQKRPLTADEKTQQDYVVMLSDFHLSKSSEIEKNLKKDAEFYQNQHETLFDVLDQIKQQGLKATWQDRRMWNQMRMSKTDLSDVTGYTFLVNGRTPEQNWTGYFQSNDKVRLRFVNASAMSFFDVRIPHLKMTVVSADGQAVQPVAVDEFRIGAAETYDVIVEPKNTHYQIQAESIDRSGFALASLQNQSVAMTHEVPTPEARPRALLTMEDMGHGSGTQDHAHMDHAQMNHEQINHEQMSHAQTSLHPSAPSTVNHSQMDHSKMDHSKMGHGQMQHDHSSSHGSLQTDSSTHVGKESHAHHSQPTLLKPEASTEKVYGWSNASTPAGHKALQYADLKSRTPQPDTREAEQNLVIRLGGNMHRYIWTINDRKFNEAVPLKVKYGERIRLTFVNESMMAHPMHLHGMFMQLENGQAVQELPNKHTIVVPPGKTVTALLTANELGDWAIHCHLLYHMTAGMMSRLIVAEVEEQTASPHHDPLENNNTVQGDAHAHH